MLKIFKKIHNSALGVLRKQGFCPAFDILLEEKRLEW